MQQPPETSARRAAGRAVRDLGHVLVGHHATADRLANVAQSLRAIADELEAGPPRQRDPAKFGSYIEQESPTGVPLESYDDRPFSGRSSPWGLDLEVHRRGDEVEATLALRSAHEGAPGRAHGGIVAGLFDDVFGFVLGVVGQPAFTGELAIRYERPTPLHRPLLCRGRLAERSVRKLHIEGELLDKTATDQPVLARATGLFIAVDPAVFAETMQLPAPPPGH